MRTVNIHEAKTQLSKLVADVEAGEDVVIARAGKPVARIVRFGGVLGGAPVRRHEGARADQRRLLRGLAGRRARRLGMRRPWGPFFSTPTPCSGGWTETSACHPTLVRR
jgi:antitoxin (DNA-binding transcriptional repressor) of toxin-antitoxin stability system